MKILFLLFSLMFSSYAQEVHYLNRSPRGMLTGDAYLASATDEYSLFYNPAALGRHYGFSMTPFQVDASATNVLAYEDKFKNFPQHDPIAISDRVMGVPVHAHAGTTPGVKMGGFGFSGLVNQTGNIILRNKTSPTMDIDYIYDRGYVIGYGHAFGSGKPRQKKSKKKKNQPPPVKNGYIFSVGAAYKSIYRDSLSGSFPLFGTELINVVSSAGDLDYKKLRDQLGYTKGKGEGFDAGIDYTVYKGNTETSWAISALDIGDTSFSVTQGTGIIPKQKMMIMSGLSFKQDFGLFDYRLSLDLHPINSYIDLNRKIHAGVEFGPKIVRFLGGYNAGYMSYGAMVDLFIFRVIGGFYGIETGSKFKDEESKRFLIYASLLDFSFEVL